MATRPVTEVGFDHEKFAVYVWRSVREDGDTKTELSRRTLEIPDEVARALREHHVQQTSQRLKAGKAWQDNDLVFAASVGTALDAANVRCSFRRITKAAGLAPNRDPEGLPASAQARDQHGRHHDERDFQPQERLMIGLRARPPFRPPSDFPVHRIAWS
jgi:hypothetical protein